MCIPSQFKSSERDHARALMRGHPVSSLIEDAQAKDGLLKKLIADHEPSYGAQWQGLGPEFAQKTLGGIVGFELRMSDWQCKAKLSQHRAEARAALRALYAQGDEYERAPADWMDRLG